MHLYVHKRTFKGMFREHYAYKPKAVILNKIIDKYTVIYQSVLLLENYAEIKYEQTIGIPHMDESHKHIILRHKTMYNL